MATTAYTIEKFSVHWFEAGIDDHSDMKMKIINTGSTEYPTGSGATGAQALTGSWAADVGALTVTYTPSAGHVFTATANWGTIDSVHVWYDTDASDYEVPLDTNRNLAGANYELTVSDITLTFS